MKSRQVEDLVLTVEEVAERLRVGRNVAYSLCQRPDFPARRIGKLIRVSAAALDGWMRSDTPAGTAPEMPVDDPR